MNGQGFYQIPGVDFQESFSPVVHEITIRCLLIIWIVQKLSAMLIDVETAFLYGELDEEIYMKAPKGYVMGEDECLLLLKSIYGLVQSSRQWRKKFVTALKTLGFKESPADPCLMIRRCGVGVCLVALYIDDIMAIGTEEALEDLAKGLKEHFIIKIERNVSEYVGCTIKRDRAKTRLWVTQPHLIKTLEHSDLWRSDSAVDLPMKVGEILLRPTTDEEIVSAKTHSAYREAVGKLLYLTKTRPELCNPLRELSKHLGKPTMSHVEAVIYCMNYVWNTRFKAYKIHPLIAALWILEAMCDSDYSGDKDSRLSISGYVIWLMKVAIAWKSKAQKSVTLSSTEAEYVAITECVQEVLFVKQVLSTMGIQVQLPITVYVGNVGAIFVAKNASTKGRTKHIDIRYHFIRELIEDGTITIVFVRSEDNASDIFTKNVTRATFNRHIGKFVCDVTQSELELQE